MCIVRRVAETVGALNPAEDDCQQFYQQVLNSLSAEELAEWRRQSNEIESLFPIYGSFGHPWRLTSESIQRLRKQRPL